MYDTMMDSIALVGQADAELAGAMERELERQRRNIELIASENIVSPAVMAAMGSVYPVRSISSSAVPKICSIHVL